MTRKELPIETKFWSKVDKSGECWLWTGSVSHGYGRITIRGKGHGAHQIAYMLEHGEIPHGFDVCHNCPGGDNPLCVRPSHLWVGTHLENMRDANNKGSIKRPRGEFSGRAKLTDAKIIEIKTLYNENVSQRSMAKKFGVSQVAIWQVVHGKSWAHIT